jgi:hypothetical protein
MLLVGVMASISCAVFRGSKDMVLCLRDGRLEFEGVPDPVIGASMMLRNQSSSPRGARLLLQVLAEIGVTSAENGG